MVPCWRQKNKIFTLNFKGFKKIIKNNFKILCFLFLVIIRRFWKLVLSRFVESDLQWKNSEILNGIGTFHIFNETKLEISFSFYLLPFCNCSSNIKNNKIIALNREDFFCIYLARFFSFNIDILNILWLLKNQDANRFPLGMHFHLILFVGRFLIFSFIYNCSCSFLMFYHVFFYYERSKRETWQPYSALFIRLNWNKVLFNLNLFLRSF